MDSKGNFPKREERVPYGRAIPNEIPKKITKKVRKNCPPTGKNIMLNTISNQ